MREMIIYKSAFQGSKLFKLSKNTLKTVKSKHEGLCSSIVHPQRVSSIRHVPSHIEKPSYVTNRYVEPIHQIEIKSSEQIEGLRQACALARKILMLTSKHLKVGLTTDEIDRIVHQLCIENNAYPSPLLYEGFPKSVCTSVNNVACHGIPDDRPLQQGDIINIDVTVFYQGYHGDVSETYPIGNITKRSCQLIETAKHCLEEGIMVCRPGARFCDIGNTISRLAEMAGFSVIPVFCGHGIGSYFHGPPDIYHIKASEDDERMTEGMAFTVEPIISEGGTNIEILEDGWTAVTTDNSRTAQFEHTVVVTAAGIDVLTQ